MTRKELVDIEWNISRMADSPFIDKVSREALSHARFILWQIMRSMQNGDDCTFNPHGLTLVLRGEHFSNAIVTDDSVTE